MAISGLSKGIDREPVSLPILLSRGAPKQDICASFFTSIAHLVDKTLNIHEQLEKHHLLPKDILPAICNPAADEAWKHPLDIRRVRLDITPPRTKATRDNFVDGDAHRLPKSLNLGPNLCLRESRIQEAAGVVGRSGAKVDAPGSSSIADSRASARTANGQDDAVGIYPPHVAVELLLLDLEGAYAGVVNEELVLWDAATKCVPCWMVMATMNRGFAYVSTSTVGV